MSYRWVLAAYCACGLLATASQAQVARQMKPQSRSTVVRTSHELTPIEENGGVNMVFSDGQSGGPGGCPGGCQGGGHAGCSCAPGGCYAVPYPRCFKFQSPCPGGAMGCDLCCGTIFSEMYCSLQGGLARLKARTHSLGSNLFQGLTGCGCCDCGDGCSGGCSCGDCFGEPACGIADAGCGIADAGCGIAATRAVVLPTRAVVLPTRAAVLPTRVSCLPNLPVALRTVEWVPVVLKDVPPACPASQRVVLRGPTAALRNQDVRSSSPDAGSPLAAAVVAVSRICSRRVAMAAISESAARAPSFP